MSRAKAGAGVQRAVALGLLLRGDDLSRTSASDWVWRSSDQTPRGDQMVLSRITGSPSGQASDSSSADRPRVVGGGMRAAR